MLRLTSIVDRDSHQAKVTHARLRTGFYIHRTADFGLSRGWFPCSSIMSVLLVSLPHRSVPRAIAHFALQRQSCRYRSRYTSHSNHRSSPLCLLAPQHQSPPSSRVLTIIPPENKPPKSKICPRLTVAVRLSLRFRLVAKPLIHTFLWNFCGKSCSIALNRII